MAKVRNIARTSYADPKIGLKVKPGEVATLPDHIAYELVKVLPWHFEIVKEEPKAVPAEPAPVEKKRKRGDW